VSYVDALSELEDFEDGKPWCDLVFDVVDHRVVERGEDGREVSSIDGRALADMRGALIGFGFEIPLATWHLRGDPRPDHPAFHWSRIELVSAGSATDELVKAYGDWFDLPHMVAPAAGRFRCAAVALEDGPPDPLGRKTDFKLFFEAPPDSPEPDEDDGEGYAELYFNLDLAAKRAWLREKDPGYRLPLLRFLTGELATPGIPVVRQ
jgi:hypothetical protein